MPLILGSFTVTFLAKVPGALLKDGVVKSVYMSDDWVLSISFRVRGWRRRMLRFLNAPGFAPLCVDRQT